MRAWSGPSLPGWPRSSPTGEYVIETCRDIERFARSEVPARSAPCQHLSAFLRDNPCFAELTRQRAISYWDCYYRYQHPSQDTYPALVALSVLSGGGMTSGGITDVAGI